MSLSTFTSPNHARYFEDYLPGAIYEFGSIAVEESEIIEFARKFDPQVFHLDPIAARETMYGGLIASGWHTAALMMRLYVDHYLPTTASLGSPGIDELRWLKPVRPGNVLSMRVTILEANRSRSKPDRGIVRSFLEVMNQTGEVVLTMKGTSFLLCRNGV